MSVAVAIYTGEREREGVGMGSQLGKREMERMEGRRKERRRRRPSQKQAGRSGEQAAGVRVQKEDKGGRRSLPSYVPSLARSLALLSGVARSNYEKRGVSAPRNGTGARGRLLAARPAAAAHSPTPPTFLTCPSSLLIHGICSLA